MTGDWRDYLSNEDVGNPIRVTELPDGEIVDRIGRSLIVRFPDKRRIVLSSANFNGGLFEHPDAVFNTTGIGGDAEKSLMGGGPEEHKAYSEECAKIVGLNPEKVVGLGTAVTMDKAAIITKSSGRTRVSAIVTAGVEGNGGRAGDPATYDQLEKFQCKTGTIVIILLIEANIPIHSMARAIVTATEAKACALQQLMASSIYSTGIATGSGTDQIAIICNEGSDIELSDAGKHSLLGELIGKCVLEGVLKALDNWAKLNPESQRNAFKRLSRYKVKESDYLKYAVEGIPDQIFLNNLKIISTDERVVAGIAAAIHMQDEIGWGLIKAENGKMIANGILSSMLKEAKIDQALDVEEDIISNATKALSYMALKKQGDY